MERRTLRGLLPSLFVVVGLVSRCSNSPSAADGGPDVIVSADGGTPDADAGPPPTSTPVWQQTSGPMPAAGNEVAATSDGRIILLGAFQRSLTLDAGTLTQFDAGDASMAGSFDYFVAGFDNAGQSVFARSITENTTGSQTYSVWLAPDAQGNVAVAGWFADTANLGGSDLVSAGGSDVVVAKLQSSGAHVWSKRFGGANDDAALGVAVAGDGSVAIIGAAADSIDFGGGPITGTSNTYANAFVARLGADGSYVWAKIFGTENPLRVAADATGNVYALFGVTGTPDFGGGLLMGDVNDTVGNTPAVVKFDPAGNYVWGRVIPNQGFLDGVDMIASQGDVFLSIDMGGSIDFGPPTTPKADGTTVARLAGTDGHSVWAEQLGNPSGHPFVPTNLAPASGGDVLATIPYDVGNVVTVVRLDPSGTVKNAYTLGQSVVNVTWVTIDPASNVFATGKSTAGAWLARYPPL